MSEQKHHHHVPTTPGEAVAPEIVDHPIHREPGTHTQAEDTDWRVIALVGGISAALMVVTVLLLQAWYYTAADMRKEELDAAPNAELTAMREQQAQQLTTRWIDADKKKLAISIDRAKELVLAEMQASQAESGVKVPLRQPEAATPEMKGQTGSGHKAE